MVLADSRRIPRAPRYSGAALLQIRVSPTGLSPAPVTLSSVFGYPSLSRRRRPSTPARACTCEVWPPARSLATTCAIVVYFLFLRVLRCFSSPRSPHITWCRDRSRRVSPFGHRRVIAHLPLTAAFRSLSRPSSPPRATGIPHAPFLSFLVPFALLTCILTRDIFTRQHTSICVARLLFK